MKCFFILFKFILGFLELFKNVFYIDVYIFYIFIFRYFIIIFIVNKIFYYIIFFKLILELVMILGRVDILVCWVLIG